ncbi:hypothetical protein ACLF3G_28320 [Falsiroseomonas sp. HC035]|uniref:hypothetical protein n=1 Tax=Falsiroseomonas sp. HC035 TaxID=3390999 RepID=UPI003D31384E
MRRIDHHSKWSHLRKIGNSLVVRATVIMPVVGYLILLNQQMLEVGDIAGRFQLFKPDTPWRLLAIYYGTLSLGLGSMIYLARCPDRIRKYETAVDYSNSETRFFSEHAHRDYLERDLIFQADKLTPEQQKYEYIWQIYSVSKAIAGSSVVVMMTQHWNVYDLLYPWSRFFARFFFWLGFIILAVPSIITVGEVTWYTLRIMGIDRWF